MPQKFSIILADIVAVARVPVGNGETRRRLLVVGYVSEDREVPAEISQVAYRLAPVSLVTIIDELLKDAELPEDEEPVRRVVRPKGIGGNISVSYLGTAKLAVDEEAIRQAACEGLRRIAENGRKVERLADDYADCLQPKAEEDR